MKLFSLIAALALLAAGAAPLAAQDQLPLAPIEDAVAPAPTPPPVAPDATELDHVVAVIGPNVILQSDVDQERRLATLEPLSVLPGQNNPDRALRRLINRTLILQQMKEQQQPVSSDPAYVDKALLELRTQIPACRPWHCETAQGWNDFLRAHKLTSDEVRQRWSQRMAILQFIDLRFRGGIRVTPEQVSNYYHRILTPALAKTHEAAPPLASVEGRIHEIVLQQQVSGLFRDWLSSLRDQGNVQVVDSAYSAELSSNSADEDQSQ